MSLGYCVNLCSSTMTIIAEAFSHIAQMQPVIDFRNGRYQGQTREQLPHGFGFYLDKSFTLCAGEWLSGILSGEAMIVFRLGGVYCGSIRIGEPYGVSLYEMAEDGVRLYWFSDRRGPERVAAVMPFLGVIFDIDNSNPQMAKVIAEYPWSTKDQQNLATVAKILHLGREDQQKLRNLSRFEHYFQSSFSKRTAHIFESLHRRRGSGSSDLFLGLKAEGLGVAIQRDPLKAENPRKHHRSYLVREMGFFSKENQLRDIGLKAIDSCMKGYVLEEGVFGNQRSVVSYEQGKRPNKAALNFHNHLKRSLFYRDMVLPSEYIFKLRDFIWSFDKNLKKLEMERLAQNTIESNGQDRQQYEADKAAPQNPYDVREKLIIPPNAALQRMRHDTFVNASKSRKASTKFLQDYHQPQYIDPNTNSSPPRRQSPSKNRYSPVRAHQYPLGSYNYRDPPTSYSPSRRTPYDYDEEPTHKYTYPRTEKMEAPDYYYPEGVRRYPSPSRRDYEQLEARDPMSPARRSPRKDYYNYIEASRRDDYPSERVPYYPPSREQTPYRDYYPAQRHYSPGRLGRRP